MKRNFFAAGVLTVLLAFTLLAGCEQNPGTDPLYNPEYPLEGGGTLTITGGEGATKPQTGDTFKLVIDDKTITGTITVTGDIITFTITEGGSGSFTADYGNDGVLTIYGGDITTGDGETVTVPDGEVAPSAPSGGDDDLVVQIEGTLANMGIKRAYSADEIASVLSGNSLPTLSAFRSAGYKLYVNNQEVTSGSTMIQLNDMVRIMGPKVKMPEIMRGTWKKGNITLTIRETNLTISGASWSEINGTFPIAFLIGSESSVSIAFDGSEDRYGLNLKREGANLIIPSESGPDELHGTWTPASGGGDDDLVVMYEGTLASVIKDPISADTLASLVSEGSLPTLSAFRSAGYKLYLNNREVTSGSTMIGPNDTVKLLAPKAKMPETMQGTWKKGNITLTIRETNLTISGANWSEINGTFPIAFLIGSESSVSIRFDSSEDRHGLNLKREGANLIILPDSGPDELHGTWTR